MSYPDEDEVREILKPFEEVLVKVHIGAWDRLIANPDWPTFVFTGTGTKMMHDFIVQEAARLLDDMPGVHKFAHDNTVWYLLQDVLMIRFKKGNSTGLGQNIDTQANDDFIEAEANLLGLAEILKVELLWYPNKLKTKLDKIMVTARDGKSRLWCFALGEEKDIGMLPTPLPIAPAPEKPAIPLVTVKPVPKTDEEEDE